MINSISTSSRFNVPMICSFVETTRLPLDCTVLDSFSVCYYPLMASPSLKDNAAVRERSQQLRPRLGLLALLVVIGAYSLIAYSTATRLKQVADPTHAVGMFQHASQMNSNLSNAAVIPPDQLDGLDPSKNIQPSSRLRTDECYLYADYGMLDELRASSKSFCSPSDFEAKKGDFQSSYTYYDSVGAYIHATVFRGLRMDLSAAKVSHDITSLAQDGARHDPRYVFSSIRPICKCEDGAPPQDSEHGSPRVWKKLLVDDNIAPKKEPEMFRVCEPPNKTDAKAYTVYDSKVLLVARNDDHNPFFMVSQILNVWIMMKVLDWSPLDTHLVYLDKAIPTAIDELSHRLLAPMRAPLSATDLFTQFSPDRRVGMVEFGTVMVAPAEKAGPFLRHLDNYEPCASSQLVKDFRAAALAAMGLADRKRDVTKCLLTIISRRNYGGRNLERVWLNEDEVVERMVADFGDHCTVQAIDFVSLSIAEQMRAIVDSDVVIGMHGAGMVNVLWARPQTLVIEVFPKDRRRWGFRNICQRVECAWHEFRGGEDVPKGNGRVHPDPNSFNKRVPPDEWATFANPLVRAAIAKTIGSV